MIGNTASGSQLTRIFQNIIDVAVEIAGADFGNIQVIDPESSNLRIVAQKGLPKWWLEYWGHISTGQGTCGTALERRERVIVEDVRTSPIFAGEIRDIQTRAGILAVQSTPLISRDGKALGIFSTHYRKPGRPTDHALRLLDLLAHVAADTVMADQAITARDEFLAVASHELKTPLSALRLQLQLMERANSKDMAPEKADLDRSLKMAIKQTESLGALVEDLLDTSRIQSGKTALQFSDVDLSRVAEEVAARFAEQMTLVGCTCKLDLQKPIVGRWDSRRIEQIVANLLANAIKYAPGTTVEITTRLHDDIAVLTIKDGGPGIPEGLHERIFNQFERGRASRNVGGLGLGLFIVKNIVESKGGHIRVESQEGAGAKFIVQLPLEPPYVAART